MDNQPHSAALLLITGLLSLFWIFPPMTFARQEEIRTWLCYYGNTYGPEAYDRFDLVVFDGRYHPPLPTRSVVLGYISVGEVDSKGHLWPLVAGQPYLVRKNPFWDSWIIDVRAPGWQRALAEIIIPDVLSRGFDGLFLDTLDSPLSLLQGEDGQNFKGADAALADMILDIRQRHPDIRLAVNRGLPVLPRIARAIDFIVVESLYSHYAGKEAGYIRTDPATRSLLLDQLRQGLEVNPGLTVLTLDYAGGGQPELVREAIAFSRQRHFIPYVSTYKLDRIFFHTLPRPLSTSREFPAPAHRPHGR